MFFWWFIFFCDLIIPMVLIVGGRMMWKHTPKNINGVVGYRTLRSMKNMDTWKFAHNYCGHLWWKIGLIMIILSALVHIPFYNCSENTIGILGAVVCAIQCVVLIWSVFRTEKKLKEVFTDVGKARV